MSPAKKSLLWCVLGVIIGLAAGILISHCCCGQKEIDKGDNKGITLTLHGDDTEDLNEKINALLRENLPSFDKNIEPIPYNLAVKCRKAFKDIPFQFLFSTVNGRREDLTGWTIDKDKLEKFIKAMPEADEIMLVPAMKPIKVAGGETPSTTDITLLFLGLDTSNGANDIQILYKPTNPGAPKEPYIYEYINPCPSRCPKNFDTVFPL